MCFSKEYNEKMNILKEKSTFKKDQILIYNIQDFEKKKSDSINFIKILINNNKDEFAYPELKQIFCQYSEFLELHFLNIMEVLSGIVKYLAKYPEAPPEGEAGYAWEFRHLIKDKDFDFLGLFSLIYENDDNIYCIKLKEITQEQEIEIKHTENKALYRNILKLYFGRERNERKDKRYWDLNNKHQEAQKTIEEKNIVIKALQKGHKEKTTKKEPLPEFKTKQLKRWSDLTLYIDVDEATEKGKDWKQNYGSWKKVYYCLSPKKKLPLTNKLLISLQQYYIKSFRNTDSERKRKQRLNDNLIAWFNIQNESKPIDEHYQIKFNIEIRNLYEEHKERIGKDEDVKDWNM